MLLLDEMADPPEAKELGLKSADIAAAAMQPTEEQRHDPPSDLDEKDLHIEEEKRRGKENEDADDDDDDDDGIETAVSANRLKATKSVATDASVATGAPSTVQPLPSKPWYKQPNPLRWGKIPPVPEERIISREYKASFFSKLTFQWMTPLMTVSATSPKCRPLHA